MEYKVKKGSVDELKLRMDIIPASIALTKLQRSGWGTSRFALEECNIWTVDLTGRGIEQLKDKNKSHKILKFPILELL